MCIHTMCITARPPAPGEVATVPKSAPPAVRGRWRCDGHADIHRAAGYTPVTCWYSTGRFFGTARGFLGSGFVLRYFGWVLTHRQQGEGGVGAYRGVLAEGREDCRASWSWRTWRSGRGWTLPT